MPLQELASAAEQDAMVSLSEAQSAELSMMFFGQMVKGKEAKKNVTLVFQKLRELFAMKVARVQVKAERLGDCSRDDFDKDVEIEDALRGHGALRIQYDDPGEARYAILRKGDIMHGCGWLPGRS